MKIAKSLMATALAFAALSMAACSSEKKASEDTSAESAEDVVIAAQPQAIQANLAPGQVYQLNNDEFIRPDSKVDQLTVLDFNAVWCGPCKKLTPSFHKAAETFANKANFIAVDVDNNPLTAQAFQATSIPLVVIMNPNGMVTPLMGLDPFLSSGFNYNTATEDELNAELYNNLVKIINEQL